MTKVDFATFCYHGDAARLHAPGQLSKQVNSNGYPFNKIIVVYQGIDPADYPPFDIEAQRVTIQAHEIDEILTRFDIDLGGQYTGTDNAHFWKHHVVNHLRAVEESNSDYIVFADADCWIIGEPWVKYAMRILEEDADIFVVSPNDGEPARLTRRMSQQMFMAPTDEFRQADFNQPGWDGNVNVPGGPMPEYWGMLEGRMELYCKQTGQVRFVCPPEYRYWHHNRINSVSGMFETNYNRY